MAEARFQNRTSEHKNTVTELQTAIAERETQLADLSARSAASEKAATQALGSLQDDLRATVEAHGRELDRLRAFLTLASRRTADHD